MAILDFSEKISAYLQQHFKPSDPDRANVRRSTGELLAFLFLAFPPNCITDYELVEILNELGHVPHQWVHEAFYTEGEGKKKTIKVRKTLVTGWCLRSEFDLRDDEYPGI